MGGFDDAMEMMCGATFGSSSFLEEDVFTLETLKEKDGYEECYENALNIINNILDFDRHPMALEFALNIPVSIDYEGICNFSGYEALLQEVTLKTVPNNMATNNISSSKPRDIFDLRINYILYFLNSFIKVNSCELFFRTLLYGDEWDDNILSYIEQFKSRPDDIQALENICILFEECGFHCYDPEDVSLFKYLRDVWNRGGYFRSEASPTVCIDAIMFKDDSYYNTTISERLMGIEYKSFFGFSDIEWMCLKKYLEGNSDNILSSRYASRLIATLPYFVDARAFDNWCDTVIYVVNESYGFNESAVDGFFTALNTYPNLASSLSRLLSIECSDKSFLVDLLNKFDRFDKYKSREFIDSLRFVIDEYMDSPTVGKLPFVPIRLILATDDYREWLWYIHQPIPSEVWGNFERNYIFSSYSSETEAIAICDEALSRWKYTLKDYKRIEVWYHDKLQAYELLPRYQM